MNYTRTNLTIPVWMAFAVRKERLNVSAILRVALAKVLPPPVNQEDRDNIEIDKVLARRRHSSPHGIDPVRR